MKTALIKKTDLIIIFCCLLAGAALLCVFAFSGGKSREAVVEYRGETVCVIDLDKVAGEYTFTVNGDLEVVIGVSPEGIRFVESGCPGKLCVRSGAINRKGQVSVCLPAGVSVRIRGSEGYDGVTG